MENFLTVSPSLNLKIKAAFPRYIRLLYVCCLKEGIYSNIVHSPEKESHPLSFQLKLAPGCSCIAEGFISCSWDLACGRHGLGKLWVYFIHATGKVCWNCCRVIQALPSHNKRHSHGPTGDQGRHIKTHRTVDSAVELQARREVQKEALDYKGNLVGLYQMFIK